MRATRMSVVDFWKNETQGDGLNIRVAHGVNSWPDLVDQLHGTFLSSPYPFLCVLHPLTSFLLPYPAAFNYDHLNLTQFTWRCK